MTDPNQPISVLDLVKEGRDEAITALADALNEDKAETLALFPETLSILQTLPPQLVAEIGVPMAKGFVDQWGRDAAQSGEKVLATGIATAANMVIQQMQMEQQRRAQAQQKLQSGLLAS
ncbi:hypothetical protein RPALISO_145 [Ruegeria phage RpAliso]|nr:hypothetical protein RPALISO_145 [Ruegeria phage RpAliso]